MILQTYLNYCTHFKVITEKTRVLLLFSLQVFSTVCSSSDLVGVFPVYVSEGVVTS